MVLTFLQSSFSFECPLNQYLTENLCSEYQILHGHCHLRLFVQGVPNNLATVFTDEPFTVIFDTQNTRFQPEYSSSSCPEKS